MGARTLWSILLLLSNSGILIVKGANILFYFGVATYSHRLIVWPLVEALAARGHKVSFLSPHANKDPPLPHVTDLVPTELTQLFASAFEGDSDLIRDRSGNQRAIGKVLATLQYETCKVLLQSPEWKDWIARSQFDLVVMDALFSECGLGLAYKFKARVIYFKTSSISPPEFDMMGLPVESSWIPNIRSRFPQNMNFLTRVENTMIPLVNHFHARWIVHPPLELLLRQELETPEMPSIGELQGNISLFLTNIHYSTDYARSLPPMFVPIAGIVTYATEKKPLTQEISKFIESAENGFIYVSFGSAVRVSKMELETQRVFFNSFGNSSLKFIWKYEGATIPKEMPSNVLTGKWMPQQAILSHPRCRGFITHGGLGSIHEAIHYGVPLIVMPIFVDQDYNAERVGRLGHGLSLEITTLTQEDLESAIYKLIQDPSYKHRMEEMSASFHDRQNNPLETAVWWTEKVLRSSDLDLSLLSPLGRNQPWYVRRQLDVWLFLLVVITASIATLLFLLFKITSKLTSPACKSTNEKVKSN